jgi:hypothetical protein
MLTGAAGNGPGAGGAAGGSTGAGGSASGNGGTTGAAGRGGTTGAAGSGGAAGRGGSGGTSTGAAGNTGAGGGPPRVDLDGKKALIVVDSPSSLDDGDVILGMSLQVRGLTVTFGPATGPASIADGMNVVLISSGATASDVAANFRDITVPMIVFSNTHFQTIGFAPTGSANKGSIGSTTQVSIVDNSSPLAAGDAVGFSFVAINPSRSTSLYWGTPGGTPIKVASIMGAPTQMIAFAFEKGAMTAAGTAAARRVGFGWKTDVTQDLTVDAFKLLNAALDWTAGAQ